MSVILKLLIIILFNTVFTVLGSAIEPVFPKNNNCCLLFLENSFCSSSSVRIFAGIGKDLIPETVLGIGFIESNSDVAFIMLKNCGGSNNHFEKIMIFVNISHSSDDMKMGVMTAEKDNTYVPVVKKVCIVKQSLSELDKKDIMKRLEVTNKEIKQIKEDGYWYPDISNRVGY